MVIYPVLPYVYMGIHRETGKIYIGSRANKKQKLPPHLDLPRYRTSSKIVKPIFNDFEWHIVAEFFSGQDAYDFEQQLIHEQWMISKEQSLNKRCYHGKESFNQSGNKRIFPEEHIRKLSEANMGNIQSEETRRKIGDFHRGKPKSEEHIRKLSEANMGNIQSEETRRKLSKIINVLTPDGFVIENITMKELCSQFNLKYGVLKQYFNSNKPYKGFVRI